MNKKLFIILSIMPMITNALPTNVARAQRRVNAVIIRNAATKESSEQPLTLQFTNGDEQRYPNKIGSYAKALPYSDEGFVDINAYNHMIAAIDSGNQTLFNTIPMGSSPVQKRLTDPQAAYTFNLDGADAWINSMINAPQLTSAQAAAEMVELYGQALCRNISFNLYALVPQSLNTITALNALSEFKGPKVNGLVTIDTLFRGPTPGDLVGPYISQFLYLPIPYGPPANYTSLYQTSIVPTSGTTNDFITTFNEWLSIQRGNNPSATTTYGVTPTFIRNGRDLADYVKYDTLSQACNNAAFILMGFGSAALDPNNPYLNNPTQSGFVNYGICDLLYLISNATEKALEAAWYQKWIVHRRLRPEYFGFLVNQQKTGAQDFNLNSELINSSVLTTTNTTYGSYFLPQAYPEGAPTHPSYPSGHAAFMGAGVTILKAFFNENFVIPNTTAVMPNIANTALIAYSGDPLTVGNELNKLASNVCMGRNFAGIHYRSDGLEGMILGEQIAIALLENEAYLRHINFAGFSLTKFDGTTITIGAKKTVPLL